MPKTIVNLTMLLVDTEVEYILGMYPPYPEQQVFANFDLRQELIAYVLSRVRNVHVTVEEGEESKVSPERFPCLTEIKLQIENFIHEGIRYVLQKYRNLMHDYMLEENYGYLKNTHWVN
ncbi:MAG: hypothetical protein HC833_14745 [Leptolyngbyaceae cyanobacterium RM1_406_9]|nr:hypothetical protein [Leptolyngbyaceae cyanobacterium RM1_406_9]